jgi:hypothetical protein
MTMVRINAKIPAMLHSQLKAELALQGTTLQNWLNKVAADEVEHGRVRGMIRRHKK